MAKELKTNVSRAISDFDDIKLALEEREIEVGDSPTSEYGNLVRSIPAGGGDCPITDGKYLFYGGARLTEFEALKTHLKLTTCESMFEGSGVTGTVNFDGMDGSKVVSLENAFKGCDGLTAVWFGDFETPGADMTGIFDGCTALETVLDFSEEGYYMGLSFPGGTASNPLPLRELRFRKETASGEPSTIGPIDISYCSFAATGLQNLVSQGLPDVSAIGREALLVVTGNPGARNAAVLSNITQTATHYGWTVVN